MAFGGWVYAAVFTSTLALSLLFTPVAMWLARRLNVLDHPVSYKAHASPVPYLGGAAMVAAFSLVVLTAAVVGPPEGGVGQLAVILGAGVVLSLVGLLDDLRGLSPLLRLAFQIAAALSIWSAGMQVPLFGTDAANLALTVGWVVGVTNAFNLLDNMDGLSAGVAAIAAGFFFLIAALAGQFLVASLALALAGCALGFLRHNFHPARIYMGDAGSLFLGFSLAVLGLKVAFEGLGGSGPMVPVLVLGVAIFDTCLVTATRLLHRRPVMSGGRDHTSHRLVFVGIPVPVAVGLLYGAAITLGWLAVVVSRVDTGTGLLVVGLVVTVAACLAVLLALVPVYETSRRRHLMIREVAAHEEPLPAGRRDVPTRTTAAVRVS